MKHWILLRYSAAFLPLLFTAACGDHPVTSPDPAEPTPALSVLENEWQPFSWYVEACHESVLIEGKYHVTWSTQLNGNRWLISWQQNVVGSGVGEISGGSYNLTETYVEVENLPEDWAYPLSFTYVGRVSLVGQGSLADLRGRWRWHLTINANGTATAQVEESTFECGDQGPPGFEGKLVVNVVDDLDDGSCGPTHCSLREALNAANEQPGMNTVTFRIPGPGPHTIRPNEGLPPVLDPVTIDGTSEPSFEGTPVIELDGSGIGGDAHGLVLLAGNTTVRGLVINRFSLNGILIEGPDAAGNVVAGNYIGTDVTGTVPLGNGLHGVSIVDAPDNTVGGTAAAARNVISGNAVLGVEILLPGSSGNAVLGNYIGTDVTGTVPLGNGLHGVSVGDAPDNTVGGTTVAARNVISGNAVNGIEILFSVSSGNSVQGNHIGTDVTGTLALGNGNAGVLLAADASGNLVGGTEPGAGNLVSGNLEGVTIADPGTTNNQVQGNYIGTDASGTAPLPNGMGILILANENQIGGMEPGAGNLISGNTENGINLDLGANFNLIFGNLIGTDASGTGALGNGGRGVDINNASDNRVGSRRPGARNVISANQGGVRIAGDAHGNAVRGNFIGTDDSGTQALGNQAGGVLIAGGAFDNTIGDLLPGSGNVVAFNGRSGIRLVATAGSGNAIRGNAIYENNGLGINIGPASVTPNDPGDPDPGANDLQNFPILESATGPDITISGVLNSLPSAEFEIEFFASSSCDPSGHGEGETFLGRATVGTDENGDTGFVVTFPGTLPAGTQVTATATAPNGSTSEFSPCTPFG